MLRGRGLRFVCFLLLTTLASLAGLAQTQPNLPQDLLSRIDRAAQGLLGAGRRLAESLGGESRAVILGPADEALIAAALAAADAVVVVEDELLGEYHPENYLAALVAVCKRLSPRAVLLSNDTPGQELAPRLAHRLGGSAAGDAVNVAVVHGRLHVRRGVYGGKANAVGLVNLNNPTGA